MNEPQKLIETNNVFGVFFCCLSVGPNPPRLSISPGGNDNLSAPEELPADPLVYFYEHTACHASAYVRAILYNFGESLFQG